MKAGPWIYLKSFGQPVPLLAPLNIISEFATAPIVGDLYGVTLNQPKGDAIEFKLDDKSLMTSDIVRLLGRQPAAVAVTGNLFFAKVSA